MKGGPDISITAAVIGVHRSTRHKSGIALRFRRVHRIRCWDKPYREADTVEALERLIT